MYTSPYEGRWGCQEVHAGSVQEFCLGCTSLILCGSSKGHNLSFPVWDTEGQKGSCSHSLMLYLRNIKSCKNTPWCQRNRKQYLCPPHNNFSRIETVSQSWAHSWYLHVDLKGSNKRIIAVTKMLGNRDNGKNSYSWRDGWEMTIEFKETKV